MGPEPLQTDRNAFFITFIHSLLVLLFFLLGPNQAIHFTKSSCTIVNHKLTHSVIPYTQFHAQTPLKSAHSGVEISIYCISNPIKSGPRILQITTDQTYSTHDTPLNITPPEWPKGNGKGARSAPFPWPPPTTEPKTGALSNKNSH